MSKKLIALCACPMGLAHTFMAAQALEEAAVERFQPLFYGLGVILPRK